MQSFQFHCNGDSDQSLIIRDTLPGFEREILTVRDSGKIEDQHHIADTSPSSALFIEVHRG